MELVVEDAVFVTMAADAGPADCMLIRDGRIAAIGQAEAVRAAAPGAEVVRLGAGRPARLIVHTLNRWRAPGVDVRWQLQHVVGQVGAPGGRAAAVPGPAPGLPCPRPPLLIPAPFTLPPQLSQ
jgi:hypothetical protein